MPQFLSFPTHFRGPCCFHFIELPLALAPGWVQLPALKLGGYQLLNHTPENQWIPKMAQNDGPWMVGGSGCFHMGHFWYVKFMGGQNDTKKTCHPCRRDLCQEKHKSNRKLT